MKLNDVHQGVHKHRKPYRVGRGPGSGNGKTAGRGHKGQGARAGWSCPPAFQGGTMSLVRRVPKRGFHNRFAVTVATVNLRELERLFQAGEEVTPDALRAKGLVRRPFDVLKVLGTGELTKKLRVAAHRFSGSAKARIEAAGGEVVVLPGKTPVADKQNQGA
jgi:large subunit ribosomal protein L15